MLLGIEGCRLGTLKTAFAHKEDLLNLWLRAFMVDKLAGAKPYRILAVPAVGFVNQAVQAARDLKIPVKLIVPRSWPRYVAPNRQAAFFEFLSASEILYHDGDQVVGSQLVRGIVDFRYGMYPPDRFATTDTAENLWNEFSAFAKRAKELKDAQ